MWPEEHQLWVCAPANEPCCQRQSPLDKVGRLAWPFIIHWSPSAPSTCSFSPQPQFSGTSSSAGSFAPCLSVLERKTREGGALSLLFWAVSQQSSCLLTERTTFARESILWHWLVPGFQPPWLWWLEAELPHSETTGHLDSSCWTDEETEAVRGN